MCANFKIQYLLYLNPHRLPYKILSIGLEERTFLG
jgi:hypothetical protein